MPFVIKEQAIPQSLVSFNKWLNRVLFSLNVVIPLCLLPPLVFSWKIFIKNRDKNDSEYEEPVIITVSLNLIYQAV